MGGGGCLGRTSPAVRLAMVDPLEQAPTTNLPPNMPSSIPAPGMATVVGSTTRRSNFGRPKTSATSGPNSANMGLKSVDITRHRAQVNSSHATFAEVEQSWPGIHQLWRCWSNFAPDSTGLCAVLRRKGRGTRMLSCRMPAHAAL